MRAARIAGPKDQVRLSPSSGTNPARAVGPEEHSMFGLLALSTLAQAGGVASLGGTLCDPSHCYAYKLVLEANGRLTDTLGRAGTYTMLPDRKGQKVFAYDFPSQRIKGTMVL